MVEIKRVGPLKEHSAPEAPQSGSSGEPTKNKWVAGGLGLGAGGVMAAGAVATGAAVLSAPVVMAVLAGASIGWAAKKIIAPERQNDSGDGSKKDGSAVE